MRTINNVITISLNMIRNIQYCRTVLWNVQRKCLLNLQTHVWCRIDRLFRKNVISHNSETLKRIYLSAKVKRWDWQVELEKSKTIQMQGAIRVQWCEAERDDAVTIHILENIRVTSWILINSESNLQKFRKYRKSKGSFAIQ